jgi:serine/threonine protein kinase
MADRGRETGLEYAKAEVIRSRIRELGWSQADLASGTQIDTGKISRMLNKGVGVSRENARKIADVLKGPIDEYFRASEKPDESRLFRLPNTEEWDVEEVLKETIVLANGVRYQVCRMKHRYVPNRFGRGKFYSLAGVRSIEKPKREQMLSRHAVVSARVGAHPQLAENLSTVPTVDRNGWWIIDRWVDGESLEDRLERGPLELPILAQLARDMLAALAVLESHTIVFRELTPARVIVTPEGRAVLTDFELAKLWDVKPSVRPDKWPEDPYRAHEIESNEFDHRADVYSWGRIVTHALLGTLPPIEDDRAAVERAKLPKPVRSILAQCLAIHPDQRPATVSTVLTAMDDWPRTGVDNGIG